MTIFSNSNCLPHNESNKCAYKIRRGEEIVLGSNFSALIFVQYVDSFLGANDGGAVRNSNMSYRMIGRQSRYLEDTVGT